MVIIALEVLVLGLYLTLAYINPSTKSIAEVFLSGDLYLLFWIGLVICGLVIPLILEGCVSQNNYHRQILWIALFVLIGGLVLRYIIVEAASFVALPIPALPLI